MQNNDELKKIVLDYLAEHNTMTVATLSGSKPQAAAVFYVNIGFKLYFLSNPNSRHAENIKYCGKTAVTINQDYSNWKEIKGIQMEGEAKEITSQIDKAKVMHSYIKKFEFLSTLLTEGNKVFEAFQKSKMYQLTPDVLWYTDNSFGFGKRREIKL